MTQGQVQYFCSCHKCHFIDVSLLLLGCLVSITLLIHCSWKLDSWSIFQASLCQLGWIGLHFIPFLCQLVRKFIYFVNSRLAKEQGFWDVNERWWTLHFFSPWFVHNTHQHQLWLLLSCSKAERKNGKQQNTSRKCECHSHRDI